MDSQTQPGRKPSRTSIISETISSPKTNSYGWVWSSGEVETVYEFVYSTSAAIPGEDDTVLLRSVHSISDNQSAVCRYRIR